MVPSIHFPGEIRKISFGLKKLVSVPQLDAHLTGDQQVVEVRQHSFVEIAHEVFATLILSLLLIQEGPLSVSDERMYTSTS